MPSRFLLRAGRYTRGQVLPFVALALVALVGMGALAIDVGYWRYQQRLEQSAADSAAVAGAIALIYAGATITNAQTAGQADAATNGFSNGGSTAVTVRYPLSGPYTGNTNAVEAIVQKTQPVFFAGVFGQSSQSVSVRAVAVKKSTGGGCFYALKPDPATVTLNSGIINATGCAINFNGSVNGNGNAAVDASSIGYAGASFSATTNVPPVRTIQAADPCAAIAGCAYLKTSVTPPTTPCLDGSGSGPLPAGVYCSLDAKHNNVTLNASGTNPGYPGGCSASTPAIYYVVNGITAGGGNSILGCNVTIVNLSGQADVSGGTIDISAPTNGLTAGVAFYQPASNTNTVKGTGNNNQIAVDGLFYSPTASFVFDGKASSFTLLVVGDLTRNGNKSVTLTADSAMPGVQHVVLAE